MSESSTRHRWNNGTERRIPACESPDGNDRTEKTCSICGLVKITVHGPNNRHWPRFRMGDGLEGQVDGTPPCLGAASELEVASESSSQVIAR